MSNPTDRAFRLLAALAVMGSLVAANSSQARAQVAETSHVGGPISRWMFNVVMPVPTAQDIEASKGLATPGNAIAATQLFHRYPDGPQMFRALLAHGRLNLPIGQVPARVTRDLDSVAGGQRCFEDVSRWFVSQVRFEPYGITLNGSPNLVESWARNRDETLANTIELRITIQPVCGTKTLVPEDHAFHIIYRLGVTEAERLLKRSFESQLSDVDLLTLAYIRKSADAQGRRESILSRWFNFFDSVPRTYFDVQNRARGSLLRKRSLLLPGQLASANDDDFISAFLNSPSLSGRFRKVILDLTSDKKDIANIAGFVTPTSTSQADDKFWFFSNASVVPLSKADPRLYLSLSEEAQRIYSYISPLPLATHGLMPLDRGLAQIPFTLTSANPYSVDAFIQRTVTTSLPSLFATVDIDQRKQMMKTGNNGSTTIATDPRQLEILESPLFTNASSTSCETCHRLPTAEKSRFHSTVPIQFSDGYEFKMIGWGISGKAIHNTRSLNGIDIDLILHAATNALTKDLDENIWQCVQDARKVRRVADCIEGSADSLSCLELCK